MAPSSNPFAKSRGGSNGNDEVRADGSSQPADALASFQRASLMPTPRRRVPLNPPPSFADDASPTASGVAISPFSRTLAQDSLSASPIEAGQRTPTTAAIIHTNGSKGKSGLSSVRATGGSKTWRLLWKGGIEVGKNGYRLDGICFVAQLSLPNPPPLTPSLGTTSSVSFASDYFGITPSNSMTNLANLNAQSLILAGTPNKRASPFPHAAASTDTDLCLSLESMRGRKTLTVRGIVRLHEKEMLDGVIEETDGIEGQEAGGVKVFVDPRSKPLWTYVTNALCRNPELSKTGRTLRAIVIQLGDEGINSTTSSTILIYGQIQASLGLAGDALASENSGPSRQLILMAARRKPPPPIARVGPRPGEPLPRAPVFPTNLGKKPPPPIFHRVSSNAPMSASTFLRNYSTANGTSATSHESTQPTSSTNPAHPHRKSSTFASHASAPEHDAKKSSRAGIAPQAKKVTPGRRGEKRKKPVETDGGGEGEDSQTVRDAARTEDVRRRGRIGKMALSPKSKETLPAESGGSTTITKGNRITRPDGDIFGNGGLANDSLNVPNGNGGMLSDGRVGTNGASGSASASRRSRVTPIESKNKAIVKKRLLVAMEDRGRESCSISRQDDAFKEIFAMVNKGACFAFRRDIASDTLNPEAVDRIIASHLAMYWPRSGSDHEEATEERGGGTGFKVVVVVDDGGAGKSVIRVTPSLGGVEGMEVNLRRSSGMDVDEPG